MWVGTPHSNFAAAAKPGQVAPERLTVLAFARHRAFWRQSVEFRVTDVRLMFATALLFSSGCRPHARPSAPASPARAGFEWGDTRNV